MRHHKRHLQRLKRSQRPAVLTLNGKAEVVVQDAKAYQAMMEGIEAMQAQAGIAEGLASMVRGQGESAERVFAGQAPGAAERWFNAIEAEIYSLARFPERCPRTREDGIFKYELRQLELNHRDTEGTEKTA